MSLQTSWIDKLATSSVFDMTQQQRQQLHTRLTQKGATPTRLLASRGYDLFVAVGNTIRVINLLTFKDAWINTIDEALDGSEAAWQQVELFNMPYQVLDTPAIDFDIEALVSNGDQWVAAVGKHKVVCINMPKQGFSTPKAAHHRVPCEAFVLGAPCYTGQRILKAEWHPLCEKKAHLLILDTSNRLLMFDVNDDINTPEQWFDLAVASSKKTIAYGFSADEGLEEQDQVASFTLGGCSKDTSAWEPLTVYYTLTNGRMHALCPVLPKKSVLRRKHLAMLSTTAEANSVRALEAGQMALHVYFRWQHEWVDALCISAAQHDAKAADKPYVTVRHTANLKPSLQGPFVTPEPVPTTDATVSDMLFLTSAGYNILAVAMTNGSVHNYLLSTVDAQFNPRQKAFGSGPHVEQLSVLQSSVKMLPTATLFETVTFAADSPQYLQNRAMSLLRDPLEDHTFYAIHAAGAYAINHKPWLDVLADVSAKVSGNQAAPHIQGDPHSTVQSLIKTAPMPNGSVNPLSGAIVINDPYLSYTMLCTDAHLKLSSVDFSLSQVSMDLALDTPDNDALTAGYVSALPMPPFQPPKAFTEHSAQLNSKVIIPPELGGDKKVVISSDTLKFFSETAKKLDAIIFGIVKGAAETQQRMDIQGAEFQRQTATLTDLLQRALVCQQSTAEGSPLAAKIKATLDRNTQLTLRIERIFRAISASQNTGLTEKEKKWIDAIKDIDDRVSGEKGYLRRISDLTRQITTYSQEINRVRHDMKRTKSSTLTSSQAARLRKTIDAQ
ncbi:hypothetical protein BC940DRAFT_306224 [Gongronella butleri]|nr:hypothetical protein BC940DRAFT_306224 [Gongronella butleri]